jgi:hypothetical protein
MLDQFGLPLFRGDSLPPDPPSTGSVTFAFKPLLRSGLPPAALVQTGITALMDAGTWTPLLFEYTHPFFFCREKVLRRWYSVQGSSSITVRTKPVVSTPGTAVNKTCDLLGRLYTKKNIAGSAQAKSGYYIMATPGEQGHGFAVTPSR